MLFGSHGDMLDLSTAVQDLTFEMGCFFFYQTELEEAVNKIDQRPDSSSLS